MCKAPHFILLPWEFCPNTRVWGLAGNSLGLQSPVFYQLPVWDLRSSNAFQIHPFSRSPLRTTPAAIPAALPIHWVFFGGRTSLGQTPYNQVDCLKSDSYFSRVPHFLAHLQEKKKNNFNRLKFTLSGLLILEKTWGLSDAQALPENIQTSVRFSNLVEQC